jgi:hypothetical protein
MLAERYSNHRDRERQRETERECKAAERQRETERETVVSTFSDLNNEELQIDLLAVHLIGIRKVFVDGVVVELATERGSCEPLNDVR